MRSRKKTSAPPEDDPKVLKSYRLRQSVLDKIETIRLSRGNATGEIPTATEVLEELVLAARV